MSARHMCWHTVLWKALFPASPGKYVMDVCACHHFNPRQCKTHGLSWFKEMKTMTPAARAPHTHVLICDISLKRAWLAPAFFYKLTYSSCSCQSQSTFLFTPILFSQTPGDIGELLGDSSVPPRRRSEFSPAYCFTLINLTQVIICALNLARRGVSCKHSYS